jgi:hypothetical protein
MAETPLEKISSDLANIWVDVWGISRAEVQKPLTEERASPDKNQ